MSQVLRVTILVSCMLLALLPGCAAISMGSTQKVAFTSEPDGAVVQVEVPGEAPQQGRTPCILELPKSVKPSVLRYLLEGHDGYVGEMPPAPASLSDHGGLVILAFLDGMLIVPFIIDLCMLERFHDWPNSAHAVLPKLGQGSARIVYDRTFRAEMK